VKGTNNAAHVTDGQVGIARSRMLTVIGDTAPTTAGTGSIPYEGAGVRGVVFDSVFVPAASHAALLALVVAGATNLTVRVALNAANDATALLLLPDTFPATGAATSANELMEVRTFNLLVTIIPAALDAGRAVQLSIAGGSKDLDIGAPITRLDVVHELTGVTLQFGVFAVEGV
jgi:hypothetical protein